MNNKLHLLTSLDEKNITGGEAITIGLVCAVMCVSILCIVVWKLFVSKKGEISLPGGFKFEWSAIKRIASTVRR